MVGPALAKARQTCGSGYFKIGGRRRLRKTACNSLVSLDGYVIGSCLILTPANIIIVGPACFIGRCLGAFHLPKLCVPVVLSALAPAYLFVSGLSAPPYFIGASPKQFDSNPVQSHILFIFYPAICSASLYKANETQQIYKN